MNLSLEEDASSQAHAVLDRVSPAYPPVAGGLHTRYAPVRRSPARHCCRLLPLDLHVLSLPLAFILSQDQTLHGNYFLLSKSLSVSGIPSRSFARTRPRGPSGLLACFLLLLLSQCVNELSVPRPPQEPSPPASALPRLRPPGRPGRPLFPFGGAKVHLFFEPPNFFGLGVQKYIFFSNRQTFSQKFFEKFFFPRLPSPLPPSLARPAPAKQDRKSTAFLQSAKLFSKKFLRKSSIR